MAHEEAGTEDKSLGKIVWWGMGMLAAFITAFVIGWVHNVEAGFEKLNAGAAEAKASIDLLRYRLDSMERTQRETNEAVQETNENTKAVRQLLERRR